MKNPDDFSSIKPWPLPFPMHALQYLTTAELNAAQQREIAVIFLNYCKNCAQEEIKLAEGMISVFENLESRI